MANVLGYPPALDYLKSVELANRRSDLAVSETEFEWAFGDVLDQFRVINRHLEAESEIKIFAQIRARWTNEKQRHGIIRLFTELLFAHRRRLMRHFTGHVAELTRFEEVANICKRHDIDIMRFARPAREIREYKAEDEFYLEVASVIAEAGAAPRERWALGRRIEVAHNNLVLEILKATRGKSSTQKEKRS